MGCLRQPQRIDGTRRGPWETESGYPKENVTITSKINLASSYTIPKTSLQALAMAIRCIQGEKGKLLFVLHLMVLEPHKQHKSEILQEQSPDPERGCPWLKYTIRF